MLQKVIERMKNAPILGFHCVARKLKSILTLKLHVPMSALGVVQYCTINKIQYSFKFASVLILNTVATRRHTVV